MKVMKNKWLIEKWDSDYDRLACSLFFSHRNFLKKQDPSLFSWKTEDYHKYYSIALGAFSNVVGKLNDLYGYTLIVERSTLLFSIRDDGVVPESSLYDAYNGIHFSCISTFEKSDSCVWDSGAKILKIIGQVAPLLDPFVHYDFKCTEDKLSSTKGIVQQTFGTHGDIWKSPHTKLFYMWSKFKGYPYYPFVFQLSRYVLSEDGKYLYHPGQDTDKTRIPSEFLINDEKLSTVEMYGHKFLTYPKQYAEKYLDLRYGNWRENYIKVHGRTTFS